MFKTEESKVAVVILLTFAMLLVTGVYPQYVLYATIATLVVIAGFAAYTVLFKKKSGEPQDERSAKCSLQASRNGFIVAMVLIALLGAAVKLGSTIAMDSMVQMVWGISMATYFLSYLAYKRLGLA